MSHFTTPNANTVITLPDGYNGGTAEFYAFPIASEGNLVQVRCAEPGKEYMTRWVHTYDHRAAMHLAVSRSHHATVLP